MTTFDASSPTFAGRHSVKPLPFDPQRLSGLSERLIASQHENNDGGVHNLNLDRRFEIAPHATRRSTT